MDRSESSCEVTHTGYRKDVLGQMQARLQEARDTINIADPVRLPLHEGVSGLGRKEVRPAARDHGVVGALGGLLGGQDARWEERYLLVFENRSNQKAVDRLRHAGERVHRR